jgi:hypothetical protein
MYAFPHEASPSIINPNQKFIIPLYKQGGQHFELKVRSDEEEALPKRDFEKFVVEAVDEGLSSLGDSSKQAIYFHLERSFDIKRKEIPSKIDDFAKALEKIFGIGANFLEVLIKERLDEKTGKNDRTEKNQNLTLAQYVKSCESNLSRESIDREKRGNVYQCGEISVTS